MRLTPVQRRVLVYLANGATTKRDRDLDRLNLYSEDGGIHLGTCHYATWASLVRNELATWRRVQDGPRLMIFVDELLITNAGRAELEAAQ